MVIRGRTVLAEAGRTRRIEGAVVRLVDLWDTFPRAEITAAHDPPDRNVIAIRPALYFPRAKGVGSITRCELDAVGRDNHLLQDVARSSKRVRLSDRLGLSVGDVLWLDALDAERGEYLTINSINGASTADQPAWITSSCPTLNEHRRDAVVRRVLPQIPHSESANVLRRDAIARDASLFLNRMEGLEIEGAVQISGGTHPVEFHRFQVFAATSNSDGYFRLPPLSRVAQLELEASHETLPPVKLTYSPDYSRAENRVDFVFRRKQEERDA